MKLGSSRKPISLAMVPSARPRNGKTMLSALSQNATRPDRLAHHFVLWGDVRATRAPPIQRVSARDSTSSLRMSSLERITDSSRTSCHVRLVPTGDSSTAVSVIVAGLTGQGRNWPRHGKKQTTRKYEE